jgi:hypothetical protein
MTIDTVHCTGEVMKLRSRLAVLLQLAPQHTLDMTKRQLPTLPGALVSPWACGHVGVLLLGVLVLELVLVFFGAARNVTVLFGEDADSAGGDSVVDYGLIVLAYDVDAEYLGWKVSNNLKR